MSEGIKRAVEALKNKAEADVEGETDVVGSRDPDGSYVGRTAEDETGDVGESGAERRAREAKP